MSSYVVIEFVADWAGEAPTPTAGDPQMHGVPVAETKADTDIAHGAHGDVGISHSAIWRL